MRSARLAQPRCNVRIGRLTVDAYWPVEGVTVEIDGYAWHHTRARFERDRAKDLELRRRGLHALRYSARRCSTSRSS